MEYFNHFEDWAWLLMTLYIGIGYVLMNTLLNREARVKERKRNIKSQKEDLSA